MADAKLDDAAMLLTNGRYSNAYYLAGYAIELGLKACIAKMVAAETIPDKDVIKKFMNHEWSTLVGLAGLKVELQRQQDSDPDFGANWALASEWSPDSRYETSDITSSQAIVEAIGNPKSGVLPWIRTHW